MSSLRLNIDDRELTGFAGQTVLDIARENGIDIPTLCHDERVAMYGSCGVCVVELEGSPKLLRSCSTMAADGMIIRTDSSRVISSRKTALELLLSDHTGDCRPPCTLACPAQTDCQGYVGMIANGDYEQALKLIKDKIPLPSSIGRVCPHPCEDACRRQMVEEPIAIASLKQFAGDIDLEIGGPLYTIEEGIDTGKKVAVIGGGPGGLTAAYFLRGMGHEVEIYDAMPQMGGMLRYGIPEYRLPAELLQQEIDGIQSMGIEFHNNIKIGKDITLEHLREKNDAVIVAVGAWTSSALRCKGEELEGVVGGIDFLREVALSNAPFTGRNVAIVGGGNTAMDACRTAVRLGAENVYNIYRRTINEMPAEEIEIIEAQEEGVQFKNLTNPLEVVGENGRVKAVRLQIMELGEPDASGRRAPVAVEGKEEVIDVDTVIVAIGQKLNPIGLDGIELTKWGTISADEHTFRTSLDGVFAIGDATNNGADIAITAIGEAKKAADMVDKFLNGEELTYEVPFLVTSEKTPEDFKHKEKQARAHMHHRTPESRKGDFLPVNTGFTEEEAVHEANRCLECGCMDYFECKLVDYANRYNVKPERFEGEMHHRKHFDTHPFIRRDADKCILCGLCVRVCDEVVGATALGLVDRGFDTVVKPALDVHLNETDCIACGQCVHICPTGALAETMQIHKQVPVREQKTETVCSFCSVGCKQTLTHTDELLVRSLPTAGRKEDALLCMKGRFGFGEIAKRQRLVEPLVREDGGFQPVSFIQAAVLTNTKLKGIQSQYGADSIAVTISDRYTNEEAFIIGEFAKNVLGTSRVHSMNNFDSGLKEVLGRDASTATVDELQGADVIVLAGTTLMNSHAVVGMQVRRAVQNGAKLILMSDSEDLLEPVASVKAQIGSDNKLLKEILKVAVDSGRGKNIAGYSELASSLADVTVSDQAKAAADMYLGAKKAIIIYQKYMITADASTLIADLALIAGQTGSPRCGIIQLLGGSNAQGLADLGIKGRTELEQAVADKSVRGIITFGEDLSYLDLSGLDFLAVHDLHMTGTAEQASLIIPASSFAEAEGSFTSMDGKIQNLQKALEPVCEYDTFEFVKLLGEQAAKPFAYRDVCDIQNVLANSSVVKGEQKLVPVASNSLWREKLTSTNALYVQFMEFAKEHQL